MPRPDYERSVFINCPFDEDYSPVLQAILFGLFYLGFIPRIATEKADSGEVRLEKIKQLIESSRFSIHDLSRCQAKAVGEHYRLNMPFELGLDHGCRQYSADHRDKRILILEEKPYRYQAALSDLAGCDIQSHGGAFDIAVRKVRGWLASEAGLKADGPARILTAYASFQAWHYESQLARGFSEQDIQDYHTAELLEAMRDWFVQGRPAAS